MEKVVFSLDKLNNEKIKLKKMTKYVRIRYNNSKLMLSTPLLRVSSINIGKKISSISLSINNENEKEYNFGKKMVDFDKFIFNCAKENRNWFEEENYNYIGLINENEITFKFRENDNIKIKCNGENIDIKELKKNYLVKVIFDVSGIFINNTKFGIYLKPYLFDINVEYIFNESEEDVDENLIEETNYSLSSSESEKKENEKNSIEMNNLTA
jgi:hypothetical protein